MRVRHRNPSGFTLLELLVMLAVIATVAVIAVPGLLRARHASTEASAIASLRDISSSQTAYVSTCGNGYYAPTLAVLGTPPTGGGAPFISPDLAAGNVVIKSGYTITMAGTTAAAAPPTCNGVAAGRATSGYHATATAGIPGLRCFGVNTPGTIYQAAVPLAMTDTTAPPGAVPIR